MENYPGVLKIIIKTHLISCLHFFNREIVCGRDTFTS